MPTFMAPDNRMRAYVTEEIHGMLGTLRSAGAHRHFVARCCKFDQLGSPVHNHGGLGVDEPSLSRGKEGEFETHRGRALRFDGSIPWGIALQGDFTEVTELSQCCHCMAVALDHDRAAFSGISECEMGSEDGCGNELGM